DGMLVLKRIWKRDPPAPDVEVLAAAVPALESLADCVQGEWVNIYEHEHPRQAAAWRERFAKCGFQFPPAQSIETGEAHPVLGAVRKHGWTVPSLWPPRMDGTMTSTGPPTAGLMSAQDERDLANLK